MCCANCRAVHIIMLPCLHRTETCAVRAAKDRTCSAQPPSSHDCLKVYALCALRKTQHDVSHRNIRSLLHHCVNVCVLCTNNMYSAAVCAVDFSSHDSHTMMLRCARPAATCAAYYFTLSVVTFMVKYVVEIAAKRIS